MKRLIHPAILCTLMFLLVHTTKTNAQCLAGATRDTLAWDYLDFLPNTGSYVLPTAYITLAQSQTQRFAFGSTGITQSVTVTHNYSGANDPGNNITNTAETGSYGTGSDVQFLGDGAVTFTFQAAVNNIKFSVYDIDRNQKVTVTAFNGAFPILITTLAKISGTVLTVAGSGTFSASATASNNNVANNNTDGTINVDIAGPVTKFTLTVTNTSTNGSEDGSFWISDVSACYTGTFFNNYYIISKPFTNQPSYVLAVRNDSVYYVNIANGKGKFLFADYGNTYINSLAYDPYRHMVYYTYSLSGPGGTVSATDRVLRRYDYDMDTLGVVTTDIRNFGVPLYDQSIESGAAAFYDGCLYLGIEGGNSVTDRKSAIWKINFPSPGYGASGLAVQAFGTQSNIHDWADFGINNGVLYDFNGSSGNEDFNHKNLITGSTTKYNNSPTTLIPRQVGVDWTGQLYNIGSPSTISAGTIVPYSYNGSVNTGLQYNISFLGANPVGSWGDAAEAFKPKTDYGDAPATYDAVGPDPGTHEEDDSLHLGKLIGVEWAKKSPFDGTGDGAEEDGLSGPQIISTGVSNYVLPVSVYNHTGAAATLIGWIDINRNGTFEPSEGRTATVSSMATQQTINLLWTGINMPYAVGTTTFMRLRLTSAANTMTTSNPTGFFDNGEIEDYKLTVSVILPDQNVSLKAQKAGEGNVNLTWDVNDENGISAYELERSRDGVSWRSVANFNTTGNTRAATYSYLDTDPDMPLSFFRIKAVKNSGEAKYSNVKLINFKQGSRISLSPNPASSTTVLNIQSAETGIAQVNVLDFSGRVVLNEEAKVMKGSNDVELPVVKKLSSGVYKVSVQLNDEILISTLVVVK